VSYINEEMSSEIPNKYFKKNISNGRLAANKSLQLRYFEFIDLGYYQTSFDIDSSSNDWHVKVKLGQKYDKITLIIPEKEPLLRQNLPKAIGRQQTTVALTRQQLSNFLKQSFQNYLNNGFPLVSIQLMDFEVVENKIQIKLELEKGPYLFWKEIIVKGDSSTVPKIMEQLSGVRMGTPYSENVYQKIPKRLDQFAFLESSRPPELLFTPQGVDLYVYVRQKKISSVQGAVGLQPNPITGQVALTGEFQTKLWNVFKRAEQLDFHWRSIQPGTQSLNIKAVYPFLLRSPFGIESRFQLYKRDSTFLELQTYLAGTYTFRDGSVFKLNYNNLGSNLLSGAGNSPQLATSRTNFYGISYQRRQLDYFPNPSKGNSILLSGSLGNRKVQRLESTTSSTVWRISFQSNWFIPLASRHVLKLGGQFETYYAPEIFINERLRYGGLNSFRGFNEDELNTTTIAIATIEYRFLVDKNSNAFVFFDQGMYEDRAGGYRNDRPFSLGTGFSFGSRLGIFTISYAIGNQLQNPLNFREGKIHFGYSAFF